MYLFPRVAKTQITRSEGKIKSYESCTDARAWSHDIYTRDRYLREWIKCDSQAKKISICPIAGVLIEMTRKSVSKTVPRCHRDCRSKVLLESINKSCHVMRECLKENEKFDKYFHEEEFETSHWPCERCLDALKGVKMLWKIILEKLFNTVVPTEKETFEAAGSVESLTKTWLGDITQQATFVKQLSKDKPIQKPKDIWKQSNRSMDALMAKRRNPSVTFVERGTSKTKNLRQMESIESDSSKSKYDSSTSTCQVNPCVKSSKCTLVRVRTVDAGCDSGFNVEEELKSYKANVQYLQKKVNSQLLEMDKLKEENVHMKAALNELQKSDSYGFKTSCDSSKDHHISLALVPKSCEAFDENNPVANIDSEMFITVKNCKNDSFRHISVLQVLHKSNDPVVNSYFNEHDASIDKRNDDPLDLLNKVQSTFEAMVRREVGIICKDKRLKIKVSDIDASYEKIIANHSNNTKSSASNFSSAMTYSDSIANSVDYS